jgi:Sel1 repeat
VKGTYENRVINNLTKYGINDLDEQRKFMSSIIKLTITFLNDLYANEEYEKGNYKAALPIWTENAELGDTVAEFGLSSMYMSGQGVEQDFAKEEYWCNRAAHQGLAAAQILLARNLETGQGVSQDYTEALKWFDVLMARATRVDGKGLYALIKNERDSLESKMIPADIARAQSLAESCLQSQYQQCD